ncbi:MAG TPA: J domain-containing protein [Anaeromyxobacteraceae bacterium]|nr:J domain-containing protein [Anaeromyxobacteraceae bacterium]
MASEEHALAARRALARVGEAPPRPADPVAAAEARLAAVLAEVTDLDAALESLTAALGEFSRRYERELAAAFAELGEAERVVRRLQALEDEVARLAERFRAGGLAPASRRRVRRARRARRSAGREERWAEAGGAEAGEPADGPPTQAGGDDAEPPEVEPEAVALKRLYRRLARILHPDLARDAGEAVRLGELMARVNAAYGRRDRTALEVMAERVGAGEPPGDLSEAERLEHLERRIANLARIAASLRREESRLQATRTFRLRDEALRREAGARDYFEETRTELGEEAAAARADTLQRLGRLVKAARDLSRARKGAMSRIVKRGPTGARRVFDPLDESDLVRRGAAHLERQRATGPARELARRLEETASSAPWEAALTLMAFFAEAAGPRPPESLATAEGWAERWDLVRAPWPGAPDLARALGRLPRHLEVGLRSRPDDVHAGVQLAAPELGAGVRIALERPSFAALGRGVLAALGPVERCAACRREGVAVHLLRTRGLDELNGLVCPGCGAVLRSYWRYGEAEGLEALAPFALELGLVAEQPVRLAGATLGFQLLPDERASLTAGQVRRRFAELYLAPYQVDLVPERVRVTAGGAALPAGARVAGHRLAFALDRDAGMTAEELLEVLRARIERRFRE